MGRRFRNRSGEKPNNGGRNEPQNSGETPRRQWKFITAEWVSALATVVLAIFAIFAWQESQKSNSAMQGQLVVMQEQLDETRSANEPMIRITDISAPEYQKEFRRFAWRVGYSNPTRSIAYDFKSEAFIKTPNQKLSFYQAQDIDDFDFNRLPGQPIFPEDQKNISIFMDDIADESDAKDIAVRKDFWLLVHLRFNVTPKGPSRDEWFCQARAGLTDKIDLPPEYCRAHIQQRPGAPTKQN